MSKAQGQQQQAQLMQSFMQQAQLSRMHAEAQSQSNESKLAQQTVQQTRQQAQDREVEHLKERLEAAETAPDEVTAEVRQLSRDNTIGRDKEVGTAMGFLRQGRSLAADTQSVLAAASPPHLARSSASGPDRHPACP